MNSCSKEDSIPNLAPKSFSLISPSADASDASILPTLSWGTATDVDGDKVTYNLYMVETASTLTLEKSGLTSTSSFRGSS